ncbi:MAG: hypothetical protein F6J95_020395 [Leptolyngbya sp. SIO1E4]|nr:hypothetical protein [Leptolyngbya sp. SIO1E4]
MEMIAEVALKNQAGQYAEVGGAHITSASSVFEATKHTFQLYVDDTGENIALKAPNDQFLYAEQGGGTWIRPERSQIGGYETFKLLRQSDSTNSLFALQCFSGHYVSMPSNTKVTSTTEIGEDERFYIVLVSNATVLLDLRAEYASLKTQNAQLETEKQQIASAQQALEGANESLQTLVGQLQSDINAQQQANQAVLSELQDLKDSTHTKAQVLEAVAQAVEIVTEAQGEAPDVDVLLQKIQAEQEQRILVLEIQHQANSASAAASQYADDAQEAAAAAALFAAAARQSATTATASEPSSQAAIAAEMAADQAQTAATTAQEQATLADTAKDAARQHTAAALTALGQTDLAAGAEPASGVDLSDEDIANARTATDAAMAEQTNAQAAAQSAEENRATAASAAETAAGYAAQAGQTYDNWNAISTLFGITDAASTIGEPNTGAEPDEPETETEPDGLAATDNWSAVATLFGLEDTTSSDSEAQTAATMEVASS